MHLVLVKNANLALKKAPECNRSSGFDYLCIFYSINIYELVGAFDNEQSTLRKI